MKESIREKLPRVPFLILGLFILSFGVALSTKSGLGVDPSSSPVYMLSEITPLSMGTYTILSHLFYMLIQLLVLRRDFHLSRLSQLVAVFAFSYFLDFAMMAVSPLEVHGYPARLGVCVLSCAVMGLGVFLEIRSDVVFMAGEGALSAIASKTRWEFGQVKIVNDVLSVAIAAALSLIAFREIRYIREGTVISAFLVGLFTQLYGKYIHIPVLEKKKAAGLPEDRETMLRREFPLVITIEREYYSGGAAIGKALASALGIKFYDDELIEKAAAETGLPSEQVERNEERIRSLLYLFYNQTHAYTWEQSTQDAIFEAQRKVIWQLSNESCVIVGRLGGYFLRERPNTMHVFISAKREFRASRLAAETGMSEKKALGLVAEVDRLRRGYCRHYTGSPFGLAWHYRLCVDSSAYGIDDSLRIIREALKDFHAEPMKVDTKALASANT